MLLKVTDSNPWYANIMNFMVAGYVPVTPENMLESAKW
jgi:hypothetical protein